MLGQTSLLDEKASLPVQFEIDQAASSKDVASRKSTRVLWTGLGFAALMLIGVSARATHPLSSHASAEPSPLFPEVAFAPMPALAPRGFLPVRQPVRSRAPPTALSANAIRMRSIPYPGQPPASFPVDATVTLKRVGARSVEEETNYVLNKNAAVSSINRDIPKALRHGKDTNWDVYTDSLVTKFLTGPSSNIDPTSMRVLEALVPERVDNAGNFVINGKRANNAALDQVRTFYCSLNLAKLVEDDNVKVSTHIIADPSTGHEVIASRWIATLPMKRLQPPAWLLPPGMPRKPDIRIVQIEAVSNFYLDREGKIYQQLIDEFNVLLDNKVIDSRKMDGFLSMAEALPRR